MENIEQLDFFDLIKKAIDEWDPMKLLDIGAPSDEYDIESKKISKELNYEKSSVEIANIIAKTFSNAFNEPEIFSVKNCANVAEKLKTMMEDGLFYFFVDYYTNFKDADNHFKKFYILLKNLKNDYEKKVINRECLYKKIIENVTENDLGYTGCQQMVKRLKNEWVYL